MLDFFRRYQRYFFLVITVVIIISFSFFGTYSSLDSNSWREQIAFTAVNGREITRSDVDELSAFIATDNDDKRLWGGMWGPNFLNDGVIQKDFLQTGLALELIEAYQKDLREDLEKRLVKERRYQPYTHPQARFISAQNVWNYFIPEIPANLDVIRTAQDPLSQEALTARVNLFLAEKVFPSPYLRQILHYQQKQYSWVNPDEAIDRSNLSLFGYQNLDDWFGPRFIRLVSEFIINASILAEQKGYDVSRAEVLADLVRNTEASYKENQDNPNLGVASVTEYFNEQLRRLNMDQSRALKVWRQVMLFRRYFQDVGHVALVDTLAPQQFNQFAKESSMVELYRLPAALRFGNFDTLQKFEIYRQAVAKANKDDPLAIPTQFLSISEVAKSYPELVQKRYELEVATVSKKALQAKVSLKDTWNWQVDDQNWASLKKQFPELGTKPASSRDERFAALDSLDQTTRSRADAFARAAIVDAHPEWIDQTLAQAQLQNWNVGLRVQGKSSPFEGVDTPEKRQEFIRLLDNAPLGDAIDPKLESITADGKTYYRIKILNRAAQPEILTFAEAYEDGTLDDLRNRILEKYYVSIREQSPATYQKADQSWKSFAEVRDIVAEQYLANVLKALHKLQENILGQAAKTASKDQAAALRFYPYVQSVKKQIEKDPATESRLVRVVQGKDSKPTFDEQWLIEKSMTRISRSQQGDLLNTKEAFSLPQWSWSSIQTPPNGDLAFFQVVDKGAADNQEIAIAEQTQQAYQLLSADAQRVLMRQVLQELEAKKAISLDYLNYSKSDEEQAQSGSEPEMQNE